MTKPQNFLDLLNEEEKQNDTSEFKSLMGGEVRPLEQDTIERKSELLDKTIAKVRQIAAVRDKEQVTDSASSGFVQMVQPNDVLEYKKPGVQPYVMQKLRRGEYPEADYIDLHGKTIEQAYELVMKFIAHARDHELRCILIIHGKGERSNPKALMKSHVAHWLKQLPDVLAYHSAPDFKGGSGAVCIILKKSDKASIVNREIYGRR